VEPEKVAWRLLYRSEQVALRSRPGSTMRGYLRVKDTSTSFGYPDEYALKIAHQTCGFNLIISRGEPCD
jgi:hypothetical protein